MSHPCPCPAARALAAAAHWPARAALVGDDPLANARHGLLLLDLLARAEVVARAADGTLDPSRFVVAFGGILPPGCPQ